MTLLSLFAYVIWVPNIAFHFLREISSSLHPSTRSSLLAMSDVDFLKAFIVTHPDFPVKVRPKVL